MLRGSPGIAIRQSGASCADATSAATTRCTVQLSLQGSMRHLDSDHPRAMSTLQGKP